MAGAPAVCTCHAAPVGGMAASQPLLGTFLRWRAFTDGKATIAAITGGARPPATGSRLLAPPARCRCGSSVANQRRHRTRSYRQRLGADAPVQPDRQRPSAPGAAAGGGDGPSGHGSSRHDARHRLSLCSRAGSCPSKDHCRRVQTQAVTGNASTADTRCGRALGCTRPVWRTTRAPRLRIPQQMTDNAAARQLAHHARHNINKNGHGLAPQVAATTGARWRWDMAAPWPDWPSRWPLHTGPLVRQRWLAAWLAGGPHRNWIRLATHRL